MVALYRESVPLCETMAMRAFLLMTVMGMLVSTVLYAIQFSSQEKKRKENPQAIIDLQRAFKKQECLSRCDEEPIDDEGPRKRLACRALCSKASAEDELAGTAADEPDMARPRPTVRRIAVPQ